MLGTSDPGVLTRPVRSRSRPPRSPPALTTSARKKPVKNVDEADRGVATITDSGSLSGTGDQHVTLRAQTRRPTTERHADGQCRRNLQHLALSRGHYRGLIISGFPAHRSGRPEQLLIRPFWYSTEGLTTRARGQLKGPCRCGGRALSTCIQKQRLVQSRGQEIGL